MWTTSKLHQLLSIFRYRTQHFRKCTECKQLKVDLLLNYLISIYRFRVLLILDTVFVLLVASIRLDCIYNYSLYNSYTCVANVRFDDGDERNVSQVSQNHIDGLSNEKVKALQIDHQGLLHMPRGVEQFYSNLQTLRIFYTLISEISSEDLKLSQLEMLAVHDTLIRTLSGDLFQHTPKLSVINFSNSRISHIGLNVLRSMYKFKSVYLKNNVCVNVKAENDMEAVAEIINTLAIDCPPLITTSIAASTTTDQQSNLIAEISFLSHCECIKSCLAKKNRNTDIEN